MGQGNSKKKNKDTEKFKNLVMHQEYHDQDFISREAPRVNSGEAGNDEPQIPLRKDRNKIISKKAKNFTNENNTDIIQNNLIIKEGLNIQTNEQNTFPKAENLDQTNNNNEIQSPRK